MSATTVEMQSYSRMIRERMVLDATLYLVCGGSRERMCPSVTINTPITLPLHSNYADSRTMDLIKLSITMNTLTKEEPYSGWRNYKFTLA